MHVEFSVPSHLNFLDFIATELGDERTNDYGM
jgi:hypothetical protein